VGEIIKYNPIILNDKQRAGLELAISRYNNGYPYTCIAGYAGTGKSTLVSFIIDAIGVPRDKVAYAAYTGKASLVLQRKGCKNAMTTHKLLYNTKKKSDGSFFHIPKYSLDKEYDLIVIDEISMLPKTMWELLLKHHVHVLALGDPGQLPPVASDEDNHVLDSPHIFLDEIMRQEETSEIITWSMYVRKGNELYAKNGNEVKVLPHSLATPGMCKWADQIICATNAQRDLLNCEMRKALFNIEDRFPVDGDKVICLRNDWDCVNGRGDCLINGMTGTIHNIYKIPVRVPYLYNGFAIQADFLPDFYEDLDEPSASDPYFRGLIMDYKIFMEGKPTLTKENYAKLSRFIKPKEFDYGYAITCWKSQGSEYNKVLLYEEGFPRGELHQQYLYTGITRACEKLVIIMK